MIVITIIVTITITIMTMIIVMVIIMTINHLRMTTIRGRSGVRVGVAGRGWTAGGARTRQDSWGLPGLPQHE